MEPLIFNELFCSASHLQGFELPLGSLTTARTP